MNNASPIELAFGELLRRIIREEIQALHDAKAGELLTPDELAAALKVPVSWVYEQSRQHNIPTRRLGRYIRFSLQEVIESQKGKA
jgi:excisionase family DNA binding protein